MTDDERAGVRRRHREGKAVPEIARTMALTREAVRAEIVRMWRDDAEFQQAAEAVAKAERLNAARADGR